MYHHIAISPIGSRYYVTPDTFDSELRLLRGWDYTTITTTQLVQAITEGASLPPHPLILTFDDANEDNYTNAFPLMQKYGFTGVLYVPYDYIGTPGYLTVENIKEMAAAGWEVGSHSLTHPVNFLALDSGSPALRNRGIAPAAYCPARLADSHFRLPVWGQQRRCRRLRPLRGLHRRHGCNWLHS